MPLHSAVAQQHILNATVLGKVYQMVKPVQVPQVRLVDPNVEPTDEELELLMEAAMEGVRERAAKAEAAWQERMKAVFGSTYRPSGVLDR